MKNSLVLFTVLALTFGSISCGGKTPPQTLPSLTNLELKTQNDVRAATISALAVMKSSGVLVLHMAQIEKEIAPSLPKTAEVQVRAAIAQTAQVGLDAIDKLEHTTIVDAQHLRDIIDPYLTQIDSLIRVFNSAGPTVKDKLIAFGQALLEIGLQLAFPALSAQ